MKTLQDRVAIVTGAAGYLGRSHCRYLARAGAAVVATDIADGSDIVKGIEAEGSRGLFLRHDVTSEKDAEQVATEVISEFGQIDILVNNAALLTNTRKAWTEFTEEEWDYQLAVDIKGMWLTARAVFPHMRNRMYGKIINISSGTIVLGLAEFLPYTTAKAGVVGFTRTLATEVGPFNINVNTVVVGLFPHEVPGIPPELMQQYVDEEVAKQAFKRAGTPDDLSPVVVFLASEDSHWITGQSIAVDGGLTRLGG